MAESLRNLGETFSEMKRRVGVGFPPPDVAQHLEITMQDPTLVYTFMLLTPGSPPVEWVRIYVHPKEQQHWETFDIRIPENEENAKV
jgi:DNA-binding GntR family transcriptional regulator